MTWYDYGSIDPIDDVAYTTCTGNTVNGDWGHTISNLTLFQGQLFMGYGDLDCNVPTAVSLVSWDIATGTVANYGTLASHGNLDMVVCGTQLVIPYTQNNIGTYPNHAYLHDDLTTLEIVNSDIRAAHMFGAALFGGQRYIAGSWHTSGHDTARGVWREDTSFSPARWVRWYDQNGDGIPDHSFDPSSYKGTISTSPRRTHGLFVIGSKLYASHEGGTIWETSTGDFGSWSQTISGAPVRMRRPMVVGGSAYYGVSSSDPGRSAGKLSKFNGTTQTAIVTTDIVWDHTVGTDGNVYYLDTSMNIKNEAGATVETAPANSRSIAYVNGVWYAGTKDTHLHATTPVPKNVVASSGNYVVDSTGNYVTYA
jgi:hypothetical protein